MLGQGLLDFLSLGIARMDFRNIMDLRGFFFHTMVTFRLGRVEFFLGGSSGILIPNWLLLLESRKGVFSVVRITNCLHVRRVFKGRGYILYS